MKDKMIEMLIEELTVKWLGKTTMGLTLGDRMNKAMNELLFRIDKPKQMDAEDMERVLQFGDYCYIEQKRYGVKNEMYLHKVIDYLESNAWVDVPVDGCKQGETRHNFMSEVVRCVCCGVQETEVLKYRVEDVNPQFANK